MGYTLAAMLTRLPMLAVLVIGMVLVIRRRSRHTSRTVGLGVAGMALMITSTLGAALSTIYHTQFLRLDLSIASFGQVLAMVGVLSWLGNLLGLGLVIAALVSSLNPTPTRTEDSTASVTN